MNKTRVNVGQEWLSGLLNWLVAATGNCRRSLLSQLINTGHGNYCGSPATLVFLFTDEVRIRMWVRWEWILWIGDAPADHVLCRTCRECEINLRRGRVATGVEKNVWGHFRFLSHRDFSFVISIRVDRNQFWLALWLILNYGTSKIDSSVYPPNRFS